MCYLRDRIRYVTHSLPQWQDSLPQGYDSLPQRQNSLLLLKVSLPKRKESLPPRQDWGGFFSSESRFITSEAIFVQLRKDSRPYFNESLHQRKGLCHEGPDSLLQRQDSLTHAMTWCVCVCVCVCVYVCVFVLCVVCVFVFECK